MTRVDPGEAWGAWLAWRVRWGSRAASVVLACVFVVLLAACGDAERAEVRAGAAVTTAVTTSVGAATTAPAAEGTTTAAPATTTAPASTSSPIADLPGVDGGAVDGGDPHLGIFYLEADSGPESAGYVPQDARDALAVFAARHGLVAARIPEAPPPEIGAITSTADGPDPAGNGSTVWLYDDIGALSVRFRSVQAFAGDQPLPGHSFEYMVAPAAAPFVAGSCEWDWVARGWGSVEPVEVAGVTGCLVTNETSHNSVERLIWVRDDVAYAIEQDSISVPTDRLIELANAPSVTIAEL